MKKHLLMLFIGLISNGITFGQSTVARWDFFSPTNNVTSTNNSGITIAAYGTGAAYYSSVSCPHGAEALANNWGAGDHWKSGALNFSDYTNLTYSFRNWSFSGGPGGTFKFQYSLNNSTWVDITSYTVNKTDGCNAASPFTDVSLPAVLENKATVYFRWYNVSASGSGGNRLDGVEFKGNYTAPACTNPDVPTVTASNSICTGNSTNLSIGGNLNSATAWEIYTGSCGGTFLGSTTDGTFSVSPTSTTTYFVRGEGGCVTPGSCGSKTISVTAKDNASFSYPNSSYCTTDSDPSATITGLAGGSFSSTSGLSITSSGVIDVSESTPGTYSVTYTTTGTCPNSSSETVTILPLDDASFSYSNSTYCVDASDPSPTITGLTGGGFTSSPSGLSINSSGDIDVSASIPNTYTVTYTTVGDCPNSSNVTVSILQLDDASFSYSNNKYCPNTTDPTPTITGLAGGTFSSTTGLDITPSSGLIDVSTTTPGTYVVTYTTDGNCPNTSSVTVFVGDTIKPILSSPSNQNETLGLNCLYTLPDYTSLVGVTDNCDPSPTVVQSPTPGTNLGVSTTVNFTITDASGNSSSTSLELTLSPMIHRDTVLVYSGRDYTFSDSHQEIGITDTLTHLSTLTSILFNCDSLQSTFVKVIAEPCFAKGRKTTFEWIQAVEIGNVSNNSGRSTSAYANYIDQTVIAEQGDTISVSLTPGYKRRTYDEAWRIWVDWNFDGDFTDLGELAFQSIGKNNQTGEIIVPNGVEKGKLAVRVIMSWKRYTHSCSTTKNGEVENYTCQITNANGVLPLPKLQQVVNDIDVLDSESIFEIAEYYPNPVYEGDLVSFVVRSALTETRTISITNSLGQVLHSELLDFEEGLNEFQLNLKTLSKGIYMISINNSQESVPLIIQ